MIRKLAVAASAWLLCAAPAWAGSFKIYEDSLGGPGVTAAFPTGIGLVADIDFDASTAEGGGLALGAAGITIIPAGDVVFMAFACQLTSGCGEVNFTPGGAGTGSLMINDPDPNPKTGLFELGDLTFDSASFGTIELAGCQLRPCERRRADLRPIHDGADAGARHRRAARARARRARARAAAPLIRLRNLRMDARRIAAAAAVILFAAPSAAGTLQFWEYTRGDPGVTAQFPTGTLLYAEIDYDADTAEGGGLFYGAADIEIRPTGSVSFVDFACHIPGCDYVFTPGDENLRGKIVVSDPRLSVQHGIQDLGAITFDAQQEPGSIELIKCNYFALDYQEHTCNRFTLVQLPEPAALAMLCAGAALLAALARIR